MQTRLLKRYNKELKEQVVRECIETTNLAENSCIILILTMMMLLICPGTYI